MANHKINEIISEIRNKKTPCLFMSPHLDDAILSCGELLLNISPYSKITIVTVFTEGSAPPYTYSANMNLKLCGNFKDARNLFHARRKEDARACAAMGVKYAHLGFLDASFRKKKNKNALTANIAQHIPEFSHIYPTYRWNILSGKISGNDRENIEIISNKMREYAHDRNKRLIFCPLGIGNHVDHVLVSKICRKIFSNLIFWEDFPYNTKIRVSKKDIIGKIGLGFPDMLMRAEEKARIISFYKSQIGNMFPNGIMPFPEYYYMDEKK